jgi:hypothetical protein
VKGGLVLDEVFSESTAMLELPSGKHKTLLIRGDSYLILNHSFDIFNGVGRIYIIDLMFTSCKCHNEDSHVSIPLRTSGEIQRKCQRPHGDPVKMGRRMRDDDESIHEEYENAADLGGDIRNAATKN